MNQNIKSVLARIKHLEESIQKGHEYLEYNMHADWNGFRALFTEKFRDGKALPPHKDWVRNVFIPRQDKALKRTQDRLEKLEAKDKDKSTGERIRHHNGETTIITETGKSGPVDSEPNSFGKGITLWH